MYKFAIIMKVMFMALSNKFIEILVNQIKNDLIDVHINKITMLNDSDFLISKSKKCKQKLFISLNNHFQQHYRLNF